eukprot:6479714-Amphidinium_carterae.1
MQQPGTQAWNAAKRMGRFLLGVPRTVQVLRRQRPVSRLDVYSDANHGGCLRTRKSTSCSVVYHGGHMMKLTCATQQPIALSSAESEYYALCRAASIGIGFVNLMHDWGLSLQLVLHGDATAAAGIANRRGAGKIRHIECATLWLQRLVTMKRIALYHKRGEDNTADLGTKHLAAGPMWKHLATMGIEKREGKAKLALAA